MLFDALPKKYPREIPLGQFHGSGELGDYVPIECLGEGAGGCVLSARNPVAPGGLTAIKIYCPTERAAPSVLEFQKNTSRFKAEALRSQQLSHKHLVRTIDSGALVSKNKAWDGLLTRLRW